MMVIRNDTNIFGIQLYDQIWIIHRQIVHWQTIPTANTTYTYGYFWTYLFLTQIESTKKDSTNTFVDMTSVWLAYN